MWRGGGGGGCTDLGTLVHEAHALIVGRFQVEFRKARSAPPLAAVAARSPHERLGTTHDDGNVAGIPRDELAYIDCMIYR